ncbi:7823_t:CDS:1, partial [Acaulospora colombiana]
MSKKVPDSQAAELHPKPSLIPMTSHNTLDAFGSFQVVRAKEGFPPATSS